MIGERSEGIKILASMIGKFDDWQIAAYIYIYIYIYIYTYILLYIV